MLRQLNLMFMVFGETEPALEAAGTGKLPGLGWWAAGLSRRLSKKAERTKAGSGRVPVVGETSLNRSAGRERSISWGRSGPRWQPGALATISKRSKAEPGRRRGDAAGVDVVG